MADEPRKRSRFDQTEPARKSRFDRRSRSPARGDGEAGSSRSPVPMESKGSESAGGKDVNTAAAAAAAAAAKINASISAKKDHDDEDLPLPNLAHAVLLALPPDFRASCLSRLVLTGRLGNLPGLKSRLLSELHQLVEQNPDWDRVASYGSATSKRERVLRERSVNTASAAVLQPNLPDSTPSIVSPTKKPNPQDEFIPSSQRPHDDILDPITMKAERNHNLGRNNPRKPDNAKKAEIRGVETLGAWAGASMVARVGVKAVHTVEREEFLKFGNVGNVGGGVGRVY
ncbi:hypothetical protein LTR03_004770 [Friedmanniomyces endolithicus]|nr:hypothetical protein LTR03_004770 [Friedmanniomyces endolithicus]